MKNIYGIEDLPSFIVMEICRDLSDRDLTSFTLSSKRNYKIIHHNAFLKTRIITRYDVVKRNNKGNFLNIKEDEMDWKRKYALIKMTPSYMIYKDCFHKIKLGLEFSNQFEEKYLDAKSDKPFLSTNPMIKKLFGREIHDKIYFKGVDYFEVKVKSVINCIAVGIGDDFFDGNNRLVGWNVNTLGYHSDDGTLRNYEDGYCNTLKTYESGDVVGFGVDWDRDIFFATKNGEMVGIRKFAMRKDIAYYPTISSSAHNEQLSVNLGREPFLFDLENYTCDPYNKDYYYKVDLSITQKKQTIEEDTYGDLSQLFTNRKKFSEKCLIN
eukprot:TRINITY_DN2398_c0_g1_i1.p1 TRINITY_DN2398_c0_g1~~TRINITY_DN2398_c0_g1_i1.p1  ORF type:complete len:324 (-),score=83.47 TRINITY_DN2398_c0_g1_i1:7-978(-)